MLICAGNHDPQAVKLLLSIGTGRNLEPDRQSKRWSMYYSYVNAAAKWATQSESIHVTMRRMTDQVADYYRLNVKEGLGKMKLDEWKGEQGQKTLQLIRDKTEAYLKMPHVKTRISTVAKQLAEIRQARSDQLHADRWEIFCHGVEYACPMPTCPRGRERFSGRQDLSSHIERDHADRTSSPLEDLLNDGKRFPLYDNQSEAKDAQSQDSDSI